MAGEPVVRACSGCEFFVVAPMCGIDGECRRRTPVAYGDGPGLPNDPRGRWPLVNLQDWCGEWEPRR